MPSNSVTVSHGSLGPPFVTSVSANGRFLQDQYGRPLLIVGDSPQPLPTNVSLADAATYFADRQAHGFNALWMDTLCDTYVSCVNGDSGQTLDGIAPFTTPGNFATPNAAYWARMDGMLNEAATAGITVFVGLCETGGNIRLQADAMGSTGCHNFGVFLGNRYKTFPNIVWFHGNDFRTYPDTNMNQICLGIRSVGDTHLHTIELNDNRSLSTDDTSTGGWASLVDFNCAYNYYLAYDEVLNGYNYATKTLPVFLGETNYEGQDNLSSGQVANAYSLRNQNWWTCLSGATGFFYGSTFFDMHSGWPTGIDSPAAAQSGYVGAFLRQFNWQTLVPDQAHSFVTAGYGTYDSSTNDSNLHNNNYVTAAVTPVGEVGVAYLPKNTTLTVAMTKMRGTTVAQWYDPSNNTYTAIGSFPNTGTQTFVRSTNNAAGDPDWVLVLTA